MSYVDLNEQRQKARRATQVILEHSQKHYNRRPEQSEYAWAQQERRIEDQAPANSFVIPDPETNQPQIVQRPPSVSRRAARFRDGLPPPPLPQPESQYPQYTPPPHAQLLPQDLVDAGITQPFRPGQRVRAQRVNTAQITNGYGQPVPQYPLGISQGQTVALIPQDLEAQEPALTKSQKKRQRRQRSAAARRGAPFPLPQDQQLAATPQQTAQRTNGVHPTPGLEHAPRTCSDEKLAETRPGGAIIRLRCNVELIPHRGQPHTMPLTPADGTDTQVYVVWWGPGE